MRQSVFEANYQQQWKTFEEQLHYLEGLKKRKANEKPQAYLDFPENYQQICQHLAVAETRAYNPLLKKRLRQLVQRGHQLLYQHKSHLGQSIIHFIRYGLPQSIRAQKNYVIITTLLFYGLGLISALINSYFPNFIYFFMSPHSVATLESMYSPTEQLIGQFFRGGDIDWAMFGYYIFNNISIAFITFATGILFCLGTLFYILYNAIILGVVASHLSLKGYGVTFWPFVIGHGAFELTAITLAGAAGLKLGIAVLIPKRKNRLEAIRHASKQVFNLVIGAFIMLIIAAFIEAYWSSIQTAPYIRYSVGTLLWILVFSYFLFAGRKQGIQ